MPPFPKRIPPRGPGKRSARQRVLAAWRGVDLEPLEAAQRDRARSVSAVMPQLLTDLRIEKRRAEIEVVRVWSELI
ncbi:MAG: hypothetical protein EPO07_13480, partial [Verrucomicrobia bacterium]